VNRARLLIPAGLAFVAGLAVTRVIEPPGADAPPPLDTFAIAQTVPRRQVQSQIETARRTAIVQAAQRAAPAVVSVNVVRRQRVQARSFFDSFFLDPDTSRETAGLGSGFILDSARRLVLTNDHVVRGAVEVVVTLPDGRDFAAEIVGTDELSDLALLRLTDNGASDLPGAPIGTSADLVIGEWAVAIGNPFGFLLSNSEPTVTAGVISGVGRNIIPGGDASRGYYLDMIQTDASINPGNSGGPLVNALGEVIGVNSSILTESGGSVGLGFAIPIDRAVRIANALLQEGRVRRAWVGADVAASEPNRFGRSQFVEVTSVAPGSPAERAGLRAGQRVESVNGRAVRTPWDWEARLLDTRVGESIDVIVLQGDRRSTVAVAAQDLPSLTAERVQALRDFEFVTLTPAIRAERALQSEGGALIVSLSDAARNIGLREGDLIVQINRMPVRTAPDAARLLRELAGRGQIGVVFERGGRYGQTFFHVGG
jgi:serine protease Do